MPQKNAIFTSKWKSSLASRQLFYILLFSSFVTLISASFQIYLEYRADMNQIDVQMEQVKDSHLPSLTNSLWHLDDEQIEIHLNEALSIKNIVRVEIRELGDLVYSAGISKVASPHVVREFPIIFRDKKQTEKIGTLWVTASLDGVYQRLYQRVVVILTSQAIKTFLVSLFILFIIYRLVNRHLISLAEQTAKFDITQPDTRFKIDRSKPPGKHPDELDRLVSAFNQMQARLAEDIRQQQKAQRRIQKRDDMIRAVFEADQQVGFIIVEFQKEQKPLIIEFSPGAEKMFGYSSLEILGKPIDILHRIEDIDNLKGVVERMRHGLTGWSGEIQMIRKTEQSFPAILSIQPLRNEEGQMYASLGVVLDISEQKELELQFRHSQKMESIGTMAGGIAHHFNNILGIILGNTELAMEDIEARHPVKPFLGQTRIAALRAKEMVNQLLNFSRQNRVQKEPLDIIPVLHDAIGLLSSSIPASIKIKKDIPSTVRMIYSNPDFIEQVLVNLGMNAKAAMSEGGQLVIKAEDIEIGDISFQDVPAGSYVLITVSDTGHGIDPKQMDRIFDPYFTTQNFGEKTGMGLAVVHGIIHEHGGKVRVDSEIGIGTRFKIYLPVFNPESDAASQKA